MKSPLISILIVLVVSCTTKTAGLQILDFGTFKLKTPQGWTIVKERGIDSYVGGLTNGKDSLWFDYGEFSPDIGSEDPKKHRFGHDTINGLGARLVIPVNSGDGYCGMFIRVNTDDRFSIWGHNVESTETAFNIFKSIVFEESDTSVNGGLTIDKFKQYPIGTGKILFQQYCGSCHSPMKICEILPLDQFIAVRDLDWLYKFITNRKSVANDSRHLALKKDFGDVECAEFPGLSREDIELIAFYIRTK